MVGRVQEAFCEYLKQLLVLYLFHVQIECIQYLECKIQETGRIIQAHKYLLDPSKLEYFSQTLRPLHLNYFGDSHHDMPCVPYLGDDACPLRLIQLTLILQVRIR